MSEKDTYSRVGNLKSLTHSTKNNVLWTPSARTQVHWMRFSKFYEGFMWVAMLAGPVFVWLQAGAILHNKSSDNVTIPSFITLILWSLAIMVWIRLHSPVLTPRHWMVMTSMFLVFMGAVFALIVSIMYRPSHSPGAFISL